MGVPLTPIIPREVTSLEALKGRSFAVDGNAELYQFLALIRKPDGTPLTGPNDEITSHLVGLFYRTTRLLSTYGMRLVFVFDGTPPERKLETLRRRRKVREKSTMEWQEAKARGDIGTAWSKAVMTSRLTKPMVEEAKELLGYMGVPVVQAPQEAEAQASTIAHEGRVWSAGTKDYDSLLFGAPRVTRYLTISGTEFLPSKRAVRPLKPEVIDSQNVFSQLGINRTQLIDVALLVGTDYYDGVKGIGPKTALKLVRRGGSIENLPPEVIEKLPPGYEEARELFLNPNVEHMAQIRAPKFDRNRVVSFLCEDHGFSKDRVQQTVANLEKFHRRSEQVPITGFT